MTKQDWIWVAIRIFGIYLLVLAVTTVPRVVSSCLSAYTHYRLRVHFQAHDTGRGPGEGHEGKAPDTFTQLRRTTRELAERQAVSALNQLASSVVQLALFGAIGVYLIRSGCLVFRWVFPPTAADEGEQPP